MFSGLKFLISETEPVFLYLKIQEKFKILTLKISRKPASENVMCLYRLLNILVNFSNLFLHTGKQCGPWSDCSWGAVWSGFTLFAKMTFKNHKQMTKQTTVVVIGSLRVKARNQEHAWKVWGLIFMELPLWPSGTSKFRSQGPGFEAHWGQNSAHDCTALNCTEHSLSLIRHLNIA